MLRQQNISRSLLMVKNSKLMMPSVLKMNRNFATSKTCFESETPIYVHIKESNIPPSVHAKIGRNLYRKENHPLCIIKSIIQNHFIEKASKGRYREIFFRVNLHLLEKSYW